jgi:hypothetical protein
METHADEEYIGNSSFNSVYHPSQCDLYHHPDRADVSLS